MIRLLRNGRYTLIETKNQTKILAFDGDQTFAWIGPTSVGEILVVSHHRHRTDHILAIGLYRIYEVRHDPDFTDQIHLELSVGEGMWQGYLLLTGLPTDEKKRGRIVPTEELIALSYPNAERVRFA